MRATKFKHYESGCRSDKNVEKSTKTNKKSSKKIKFISFLIAISFAACALIVPTTTLAPDVNAYEDSRAASFTLGDANEFESVIIENCVTETTVPSTQQETTVAPTTKESAKKAKTTESSKSSKTEKTPETKNVEISENTSSVSSESGTGYTESNDNSSYISSGNYLLGISNPDYNYNPTPVSLSSYDRSKLERLVMGEAGSMGYNGCALVAQCIRDAMNRSNTNSIDRIISEYQYYGSTSISPNKNVKDAVSYIFDQNGSAVQHRVLVFYTGTSSWHETQNFIIGCGNVRFFDLYA